MAVPVHRQAEALPPEVRNQIVVDAIDALHDVAVRKRVIHGEVALHAEMRQAQRAKLS